MCSPADDDLVCRSSRRPSLAPVASHTRRIACVGRAHGARQPWPTSHAHLPGRDVADALWQTARAIAPAGLQMVGHGPAPAAGRRPARRLPLYAHQRSMRGRLISRRLRRLEATEADAVFRRRAHGRERLGTARACRRLQRRRRPRAAVCTARRIAAPPPKQLDMQSVALCSTHGRVRLGSVRLTRLGRSGAGGLWVVGLRTPELLPARGAALLLRRVPARCDVPSGPGTVGAYIGGFRHSKTYPITAVGM